MNNPVAQRLEVDDPLIAIVGATDSPGKYGGRIYRHMKAKGYRVVGVNANRSTVDGDKAYPSLDQLPETPDIIDVVVPPRQTLEVLEDAAAMPSAGVWIQPGAEDRAVRIAAEASANDVLIDACIMVVARHRVPG